MQSRLLSDWRMLRAPTSVTSIRQSGSQWLDVADADNLVGWLEVRGIDNGAAPITFAYQFSPTRDDSYFVDSASTRVSVTGPGITLTKLLNVADVFGARYLRYRVSSTSGVAWDIMFRCWVSVSTRTRRSKARSRFPVQAPKACAAFAPGGDLAGTPTSQIVVGFEGVRLGVGMSQPKPGQVITFAKNGVWTAETPPSPFRAGGDLFGTASRQTVVGWAGVALDTTMATPAAGALGVYDGSSKSWKPKAASAIVGTRGTFNAFQPFSTNNTTFTVGGVLQFDPTQIPVTTSIKLKVIVETTAPAVTIQLYNVTAGAVVAGSALTLPASTAGPTTLVTADLTTALGSASAVYQVQLKMAAGASADMATLDYACFEATWA